MASVPRRLVTMQVSHPIWSGLSFHWNASTAVSLIMKNCSLCFRFVSLHKCSMGRLPVYNYIVAVQVSVFGFLLHF
ncbi:unnamed protein product [Cylicostephanus goldi]|uniref:Uncharacterized protein n=1 Tax=Cylicostephanus goldi TaxID=71465 RepID=A0A3P6RAF9_CYLGO|nr:unnamed protein product [Cylicostephanus goldi]